MMHAEHISHSQQTSNFTFLKQEYAELFRLGSEMEFYASQDHSCALLKARLFCELWCQEIANELNISLPRGSELCQTIKCLERTQLIPVFIIDALNDVRQAANGLLHVYQTGYSSSRAYTQISSEQLKQVFLNVFDLAQYLAFDVSKLPGERLDWQAPVVADLVQQVSIALNGSPDANLALAQAAYDDLIKVREQDTQHKITKVNKLGYQLNQQDLTFWLQRAKTLKAKGVWLLYAKSLANKLIEPFDNHCLEQCFQKAVAECETGEALAEQANYAFSSNKSSTWAWSLLEKSAELGFHTAITCMQVKSKNDSLQLQYWTEKGVEHKEPNSFTIDAFIKLEAWLENQEDELAQKKARSALITTQATHSPGSKYLKAYCDYYGYWGKQGDNSVIEILLNTVNELPKVLVYQVRLFEILKAHPEQSSKAIEVGGEAILSCKCMTEKARLQYEVAMLMREQLDKHGKVKAHFALKDLIKDAAKAGNEKAQQFLTLPAGKALMRDSTVQSNRLSFKTPDRKKQKRAKKLAKRARK